jgi:Uma2 family endonuclease
VSTQRAARSVAEFLAWEARQEGKHEFVDGQIVAFAGGTLGHSAIALNLAAALLAALRDRSCRVLGSDAMVETARSLRYPDVTVTCDPRDTPEARTVRYPMLIVEVISDSSAATDRGEKLEEYTALESLREYVLVDSRRRWVQMFRREGAAWVMGDPVTSEPVDLRSVAITVPIDDIYRGAAV